MGGGLPPSSSAKARMTSRSELAWRQERAGRGGTGHRRGIPAGEPQYLTVLGGHREQRWLAGPGDVYRVTAVPAEPDRPPAVPRWHEPRSGLSRRGWRAEGLIWFTSAVIPSQDVSDFAHAPCHALLGAARERLGAHPLFHDPAPQPRT